MIYFLDTNIFIGYVFFEDPWHDKSLKVFELKRLYWSDTVKKEFNNKFKEISNELYGFVSEIEDALYENPLDDFTLNQFQKVLFNIHINGIDNKKKSRVLKKIWEEITQYEEYLSKLDLLNEVRTYKMDMKQVFFSRKKSFSDKVILHKSINSYSELYNKLNNIHSPDNKIVLDAHDLAVIEEESVYFISSDKIICDEGSKIIDLKITKFCYLNDLWK